jgi:hypothetical protein
LKQEVLLFNEKEKEYHQEIEDLKKNNQKLLVQNDRSSSEAQSKLSILTQLQQEKDQSDTFIDEMRTRCSKYDYCCLSLLSFILFLLFMSCFRLDTENKQLLTVINQLRNARKDKTNESELMTQELQSLKQQILTFSKENSELKSFKEQYQTIQTSYSLLMNENNLIKKQFSHLQEEISKYENKINSFSSDLLQKEQIIYEKNNIIDNLQYEEKLLKKTIDNYSLEIDNLKNIIGEYERNSFSEISAWKKKYYDLLSTQEQLMEKKKEEIQIEVNRTIQQMQEEKQRLTKDIEEKELIIKYIQQENNKEKGALQRNMEKTLKQLQNTSSNVIDKTLIANLIVSYFQRRRYFFYFICFFFSFSFSFCFPFLFDCLFIGREKYLILLQKSYSLMMINSLLLV